MSEDKSNAEEKKKTVDLGLLEEDDEFEEFPAEGKSHTVVYYVCTCSQAWLSTNRFAT